MYRNEPYKERTTLTVLSAKVIAETEILAHLVGFNTISIGKSPCRIIVPPEDHHERPLQCRIINNHVLGIWIEEDGSFYPPRDLYEQLDRIYKPTIDQSNMDEPILIEPVIDELEIYNLPCDYLLLVLNWASKHSFERVHFIGQEIQYQHHSFIRNLCTPVLVFVLCAAHMHVLLAECTKKIYIWCGYPKGRLQRLHLDLHFYTPERNPKVPTWVCFPRMFHDIFIDIPTSEEELKPIF